MNESDFRQQLATYLRRAAGRRAEELGRPRDESELEGKGGLARLRAIARHIEGVGDEPHAVLAELSQIHDKTHEDTVTPPYTPGPRAEALISAYCGPSAPDEEPEQFLARLLEAAREDLAAVPITKTHDPAARIRGEGS